MTTTEDAGTWDNSLLLIELQTPNKTDVLNFLDKNGSAPARYAHVVIDQRATLEPYYQDLLVGPLPIDNVTTTIEPLTFPYTRKTEGKVRNLDADLDGDLWNDFLYTITASVLDITLDLWNGSILGLDNDTLDVWGVDPLFQDEVDGITRWDQFWNLPTSEFDSGTLLPLGLYFMTNVTGRDSSLWTVNGWLYNDVFYPTVDDFRTAYYTPGFEKLPAVTDGSWAWTDQEGIVPALDTESPPVVVAPGGSRYFTDADEQYVKWMDFEFYISFSRDTGMRLNNIMYKGERIIYELGLQEALAHYAGNDPVQSGTAYLDSFYGFGPYTFELVKGFDCPVQATYLNTSFYTSETTHTHIDSICLFETEANSPIQRHSAGNYVSVTKNIFFTIRAVGTVGNYDYQFSYEFYMDGSINIVVRASGYIQSAYFAANDDYGYQIHEGLSGSMHDHILNFKIDFDIAGTDNTMTTTTNIPTTEVYPWSNGKARNTMKLARATIESEDDAKLNWAPNTATQYIVQNTDARNAYNASRGYRIAPSAATAHLTVENSTNLLNAANWANYDLMVTRQHDTEPRSAHSYNTQDVANPPINFDDFFNSESLVQEDIVVWANLGMHHVPNTGDLPNTVFTAAHSAIMLTPVNYLAQSAHRETVNMVRIDYGGGNASVLTTFGEGVPSCGIVDVSALQDGLMGYLGDEVVRKFPYDPNDPYFETDAIAG